MTAPLDSPPVSVGSTQETASPQPTLTTVRLLLRPFRTQGDPEQVQRILQCREIAANTRTIEHPYPDGAALEWIGKITQQWTAGDAAIFAVCRQNSPDVVVGAIGLVIDKANENAEMGYWIDKPTWGQGVASEAANAVVTYGFRDLGLQRIHAHHLASNPASGKVLQKAGLVLEGTFRKSVKKWGVFYDTVHYGLTAEAWGPSKPSP